MIFTDTFVEEFGARDAFTSALINSFVLKEQRPYKHHKND
jgi:hypothetical protein